MEIKQLLCDTDIEPNGMFSFKIEPNKPRSTPVISNHDQRINNKKPIQTTQYPLFSSKNKKMDVVEIGPERIC